MKIIINRLFHVCTSFLVVLGKLTGLSYQQVSVAVSIYLQGALLALSAWLPSVAVVMAQNLLTPALFVILLLASVAYAACYGYGFYRICKHYHGPMDFAFNRCVADLQTISRCIGLSYNALNVIVFVVLWFALVSVHAVPMILMQ
ncbi:MAG: hypothetical protein ACI4A8_07535 [Muribaculaceae bacterium]